jgi:hypothetical protein
MGKGVGGCGGWVEGGAQAVVVVVGCRVCSLEGDGGKKSKNSLFFFLVSILGVVGVDPVGQVVSHMYGGWWWLVVVVTRGWLSSGEEVGWWWCCGVVVVGERTCRGVCSVDVEKS